MENMHLSFSEEPGNKMDKLSEIGVLPRTSVRQGTFLLNSRQCNTSASSEIQNLEVAAIGNCNSHFLVNKNANIVYGCTPLMNSEPIFNFLLHETSLSKASENSSNALQTFYQIQIENFSHSKSEYFEHSAILVTFLYDTQGNSVRLTDFCPIYEHHGRTFNSSKLVRMIKPYGRPRIKVVLRLAKFFGSHEQSDKILGSNHIIYTTQTHIFRLTTDISPVFIDSERFFVVRNNLHLHLANQEPLHENIGKWCRSAFEKTYGYWRNFTKNLFLPLEWQEEVIRAAITLKLCQNESTGAILAAMTTSIPESDDMKGRNWDYRFCWVRDSYHTVQSLNKLGQTAPMEKYLEFIVNVLKGRAKDEELQPLYGLYLEKEVEENIIGSLSGYRGMKPVRIGNAAYRQIQNDTYGSIILSMKQLFFDSRLKHKADIQLFKDLENVGEMAFNAYKIPDAGIWELRDSKHVHTHSSLMCWAACDGLAKMCEILKLGNREEMWRNRALEIEQFIKKNAWNEAHQTYLGIIFDMDNKEHQSELDELTKIKAEDLPLDSSLLLMGSLGLCSGQDERFQKTVEMVGKVLKRNGFLFRYNLADDFGKPKNSFIVCTFWYIEALVLIGKKEEARHMFENLLNYRNHFGILSEHIDIEKLELWGNIPQAYSMVGIINSALMLSKPWSSIGL